MSFQAHPDLAIPIGSLILVTGVSGMIAIHIADEALKAGFRVRGTVRSSEKGKKVAEILQSANFEYCVVEEMSNDGAFDDPMSDVAAVIHTAAVTNFSGAVEEVIPPTVRTIENLLAVSQATSSVRSFVFTSTSGAASGPRPGVRFHIGRDTWNEVAVERVRMTPVEERRRMGFEWGYQVYVASKIEAEKALWRFVETHKPSFSVNVVNPAMNWGKVIGSTGVSGMQIRSVLNGNIPKIPSVYMVDTVDDARIHLATAIDSTVQNERIFACDSPFNWRLVIEAIQRIRPDLVLPKPDPNEPLDISTVDNELGAALLRKWWNLPGYKGLEQTVRETMEMDMA
ncbi:NAD(P)-binding protein [Aspergillus novofumigatus IBT 16806]|uniref:NAD(P)-binding protein n=1 Tax=Aspergillus novofumigatus (strain IBT 16806) TaxID=1392255 RepID=A0A2I1CJC4_ASPN1|nr:NAD(P)-binding protein [Aspergillus novofumigatus IBT 16806]PKX97729.1 NAD(P)-binding protein [Aspergillus novofumigatus IBT 16806]